MKTCPVFTSYFIEINIALVIHYKHDLGGSSFIFILLTLIYFGIILCFISIYIFALPCETDLKPSMCSLRLNLSVSVRKSINEIISALHFFIFFLLFTFPFNVFPLYIIIYLKIPKIFSIIIAKKKTGEAISNRAWALSMARRTATPHLVSR